MSNIPHYRRTLRLLKTVLGNDYGAFWIGRGILVGLIISTLLILISPTRTVQMQARSLSAEATLLGEPYGWDLTGAAVCLPSFDFDAPTDAACKDGEKFGGALDGPAIWTEGQRLAIMWSPDALTVTLRTESTDWPKGTVLRLSHDQMMRNGALAFSGYLSVGQEISSGATGYILDGSYVIFERGLLARAIGGSPDITRQGLLRRGDRARIVCSGGWFSNCDQPSAQSERDGLFSNPVMASLTLDPEKKAGLNIVALGQESNSALELAYSGRDSVVLIRPSWIQRAAASSGLLALSLMISVMTPLIVPLFRKRET